MIAIFTALGLALFGGGIYAVYDGWPYLVLERGFTQVIIGAIASTAGLILLSLSWVLRELRAVRAALEAAQLSREGAPAVDWPRRAPAPAPLARSEAPQSPGPSLGPVLGSAAVGAVAGAAATSAVTGALAAPEPEEEPIEPQAPVAPERDLFGTLLAERLSDEEPRVDAGHEPAVAAEPLPDMFELPPPEEDEPREAPIAVETESHEPDEIVAAKVVHAGEAEAVLREPSLDEQASTVAEPATKEEAIVGEGEPSFAERELDEFSALRESLAGHLGEPLGTGTRVEPSLSSEPEPDPFAQAEAWMDRASPRREPWFEAPAVSEAAAPEPVSPPWPPRTEAPAFGTEAEPVVEPPPSETVADQPVSKVEEGPAAEASASAEDTAAGEAATEPGEEMQPETEPEASDERPASDEGIVGAYQVGDAHFTIYADGSIRARTPDGEYGFASMDELKVYLASEKSRLGV